MHAARLVQVVWHHLRPNELDLVLQLPVLALQHLHVLLASVIQVLHVPGSLIQVLDQDFLSLLGLILFVLDVLSFELLGSLDQAHLLFELSDLLVLLLDLVYELPLGDFVFLDLLPEHDSVHKVLLG